MPEVPFSEAIDFLRGKVNLPTKKWDDLRHQAHVRAFSVAGVTRDDMLADFRAAIDKARNQGKSLSEFRKDFDAIVDRTGWKFNAPGSSEEARRAWRARIIYRTNMRTSYMAGRYQQMTDPDVLKYRPYWQYRHHDNAHPRLVHLSWDGRVMLATDPAWQVMFPPNGWGCHCDVVALSKRQLTALGKDGPDPAPDLQPYNDTDPRTGQPEIRYAGIDRGWEYNVGESWMNGLVPAELRQSLATTADTPAPSPDLPPLPAPTPAPAPIAGDQAQSFLTAFGVAEGDAAFWRDPSGGIVTVSRALFPAAGGAGVDGALLAEAIKTPDEIWADWATGGAGAVLRRSYLKQVALPAGGTIVVRFEWTSKGWFATTVSTADAEAQRRGALLYRRDAGATS